jgi:UDP-N-acetylmuramoylalanine--D-glutamate ligase
VLGAGVSGAAAARLGRRLGMSVTVHDTSSEALIPLTTQGFGTVAGSWDPLLLTGVDLVVTSPGIPERGAPLTDTFEAGITLWSEIEFAWRHLEVNPVVAVTGTNGKTTVTSLVAGMCRASGMEAPALGNIGTPLSDAVGSDLDVAVVEVSSFQLRFTETFHPGVAVVTNVAPDHLDWHGSFERYLEAKAAIVANQTPEDLVVFDADDDGAVRIADRAPSRRVGISTAVGADAGVIGETLVAGPVKIPLAEIPVTERVFLVDLAMAAVAADAAGAHPDAIVETVRGFAPAAHRRTVLARRHGVTFVDDSKATNPHAALAAIRDYPSVVLIAGGLAKGLDLTPLATEPRVRALVALGTAAPMLLEAAGERGVAAGSMEQAVRLAADLATPGDVVLLAPGCASFDMFTDYGARGDAFAAAVADLGGVGT